MSLETITAPAALRNSFSELLDLANEKVGGKALFANDDFFAEKENLLKSSVPVFIKDKYTDNGKWMDGWESRRKRVPGYDFCILKLGLPGEVHGVNVDTSFFTGNYPEYASLEGTEASENATVEDLKKSKWTELLPKSSLKGGTHNFFAVSDRGRFTHLRLNIFPDGGVARLRVHGVVRPSREQLGGTIDLAAAVNGGVVVTANDMYFGLKDNLILPGRAKVMGDGWETQRKRGPGNDWIIVKLCGRGKISKVEVDTNHFKGNYPDRFSLEGFSSKEDLLPCDFRDRPDIKWTEIIPQTKLEPSKQHLYEREIRAAGESFDYVRLSIYPDGGISRLRVFGTLEKS